MDSYAGPSAPAREIYQSIGGRDVTLLDSGLLRFIDDELLELGLVSVGELGEINIAEGGGGFHVYGRGGLFGAKMGCMCSSGEWRTGGILVS